MDPAERHREAQRRHEAAQRAAGLKRIRLWVRPEDVAAFQEAARSPHALARLRAKAVAEIEQEVREKMAKRLELRTERALLAQARAEARQHPADSNAPPARVRFGHRPPGTFRRALREAGWRYDPVAAVWHLPEDPERWPAAVAILDEAEATGRSFERLAGQPAA